MSNKKEDRSVPKSKLHPRNKHQALYDFEKLIADTPALKAFITPNKRGQTSINFFDPAAVRMLNSALLKTHYAIDHWELPKNYLCPPIPGRADYLHYMADLLAETNDGKTPIGHQVKCLDVGVGASCIYPIIGTKEYGWSFIGTDVNKVAIASATQTVATNPRLKKLVELRLQKSPRAIFTNIIGATEYVDFTICNPPFHRSAEEANLLAKRKLKNLRGKAVKNPKLNFGGQAKELWCPGGEVQFVNDIIQESKLFAHACCWFSSLISKEAHLKHVYRGLRKVKAEEVKTIPMGQGNKISRIVAWTFLNSKQQKVWADTRWR